MRLERSRTDSKLFGLCGGIAQAAGIDATWIRLGFIIGVFVTGGVLLFIYILASMVIPKESACYSGYGYGYGHGWSGAAAAPASYNPSTTAQVDDMMQQLERQAMLRELQELRSKLNQYEQR